MTLGGATVLSPPPTPTTEPDPFNPDVTIWPEAPDWLFPTVMVFTGLIIAAVVVLLVMWRKSVTVQRAEREAKGPTKWIDLSKLDKKGRWDDDE
jgi:hypothetical protein